MPIDLRALPKVLLHEHLDGGLRPATVIALASACNYGGLPTDNPEELGQWFHRGANKGSLPEYLEGFAHTIAVMQTRDAIERVAFEFIEDMYHDGVVYAESRFAPCFHTRLGLTPEAVVQAALDGFHRGEQKYGVRWGLIICAMRNETDSLEWAEMAIDFRYRGVVGFDLAGEEAGYPPKKHVEAFRAIQAANFYSTLHAGEAFGIASIWQALQLCGAHRLGHATRLWRFHKLHHSSEDLDWLSAVRVHPVNDVLSKLALAVPLACLGFPLSALAGYVPFLTFYAILLRANVSWSFGPLRYVIASPLFHRWHHTIEDQGHDKNFAPLFPFVDFLFGTFYMPRLHRPERFGTTRTVVPETFIGQLMFPFRKQSYRADVSSAAPTPAARTVPLHRRCDDDEQPYASEGIERVVG